MFVRIRFASGCKPGSMRASDPVASMMNRDSYVCWSLIGIDLHLAPADQPGVAFHHVHLVLFHQELDAFGMLGNNRVLAIENLWVVELRIVAGDALLFGMLEVVPNLRRLQQRFRRNAANVQAGSAQLGDFSTSSVFNPYWPARTAAE